MKYMDNMLTVLEAAKQCDRAPETIRRWIREEKVSAQKLGMMWYIDAEDLKQNQENRIKDGNGRNAEERENLHE